VVYEAYLGTRKIRAPAGDMSITSDNQTSGTYSNSEMSFSSANCNNPDYDFTFEQNGNVLIINYPCFEPCQAKYMKE